MFAALYLGCQAMTANAGSMGVKADIHEASSSWSGPYIGVHGGFSRAHSRWFFPFDQYYTIPDGNKTFATVPNGETLGGQIGLNYQINSVLVGVEGTLDGGNTSQTLKGVVEPLFPNDRFGTEINNFATVVTRLGYVYEQWLPYVRGGFASARTSITAASGNPGGGVDAEAAQRLNGWVVGAGVEYRLIPSIILGLQYDAYRLMGGTYYTMTTGPVIEQFYVKLSNITMNTITARISLKMDDVLTFASK